MRQYQFLDKEGALEYINGYLLQPRLGKQVGNMFCVLDLYSYLLVFRPKIDNEPVQDMAGRMFGPTLASQLRMTVFPAR